MIPKDIILQLTNSPKATIYYYTFRYFSNIYRWMLENLLYGFFPNCFVHVWMCARESLFFTIRFSSVRALYPVIGLLYVCNCFFLSYVHVQTFLRYMLVMYNQFVVVVLCVNTFIFDSIIHFILPLFVSS